MRMTILLGFAFYCIVSSANQAHAQSNPCRPLPLGAQVDIKVLDEHVEYDFTKDREQIRLISLEDSGAAENGNLLVRGLTVTHFIWKAEMTGLRSPIQEGSCTSPTQVTITLGYDIPTVIYVESAFAAGTCQHDAILEHEETHARIFQDSLRAHVNLIQAAAWNAVSDKNVFPIHTLGDSSGMAEAEAFVEHSIQAEIDALQSDERDQNAYLDRPESIAMTTAECSQW